MAIDMSQFYQVFFEESAEHLAAMENLLLNLDIEHPDDEELNAIFRAAHSIKGSSGTFGFNDLAETTHLLENLLDRIRKRELDLSTDKVDAFLSSCDVLKAMLEAHQGQGEADPAEVEALSRRLRAMSEGDASGGATQAGQVPSTPGTHRYRIEFVPTRASVDDGGLDNFMAALGEIGALKVDIQPGEPNRMGFWQLSLTSDQPQESFADQLDFIADSGAWRIVETSSEDAHGDEAFGLFDDAPGAPVEEAAYGFFDPLPTSAEPQDDSYGFFEPLPTAAVAASPTVGDANEEGDGYGFFAPLPVLAAAPPVNSTGMTDEGDGYGFFAPLPTIANAADSVSIPPGIEAYAKSPATSPVRSTRVSAEKPAKATASGDSSIRVNVEKVDQLINLVGELVITQAMLQQAAQSMQDATPERLVNGLAQLERNTRDLQESVMSIRMLPISFVFSRFPRVVRDLSGKLGKQVELKTSGETTELDKSLIERIADPLTHLIRNSLDHGIESPERRAVAGKPPVGTITLKAYHQGGNIVIEVGDDGAGISRQKILAKARERGMQVSDQMSDPEVFGLIFEAGFSTAETVTDVSGRGVGMDVVRRNIQAMGGRVDIESMLGIGTRMTVRLPLTLAILDGMSIGVGDQIYILPLASVIESLQPTADDIKTMANQGRVIAFRGEYLPVVALHELFGLTPASGSFCQGILVVIDANGSRVALFVDALLGQHQVVIKSLEANYRRVPGISGATIMGDGHVAMILDPGAIAAMGRGAMAA